MKASESDACSNPESEPNKGNGKGKQIIDADPSATVATAKIQKNELEDPEEEERLFHSQMWVKGSPIQFIVDSGSQKNLISAEVVKRLGLPTTSHPQPYTIGWLHQGRDLRVSQQCRLPYNIKPFTDEVLCDIAPLEVCDVLLGQPYLWKRHAVYESRPRVVIITLGNKLYRIPEVAPPIVISLVTAKQCNKLISKSRRFCFLDDTPSRKEEDCGHDLQTGPLHTTTTYGQGCGGVRGHLHLPGRGSSALSSQALHRSDPRCAATQWTNLSALRSGER